MRQKHSGDSGMVCINHLERKHIYKIMEWRNAQIKWLRQKEPLTREQQERWFGGYIDGLDSYCPKSYLYAIYKDRIFVGYGGLVHINWDKMSAEVSFLLDPQIKIYNHIYAEFMRLLKMQAIKKLGITTLTSETHIGRLYHIWLLWLNGWKCVDYNKTSVLHRMAV
jgi:hypothetical protein